MKGWGKNFVTRVEILLNFFLIYNHRRVIFLCKSDGSYFFCFRCFVHLFCGIDQDFTFTQALFKTSTFNLIMMLSRD